MKVLVTGGTGFVGRHLAAALLREGHQVAIAGRDFSAVQDLLAAGAARCAFDLRDRRAAAEACAGMDAVYHVAALSAAWGPRAEFYAANVDGTHAVIEGCRAHQVGRLIYVSSPSVVFDGSDHVNASEALPYPQRFTSTYALTKKLGEDLVNQSGLPFIIIRPKAIFGPGDRALLPRLLAAARRGRLPQVGAGDNLVDLTFVENVVHALVLALESNSALGRTYFVTNDEHVPLWPTIKQVVARLGIPSAFRQVPFRVAYGAAALMEAVSALTHREPLLTRYTVAILARTQTYDIGAARRDLGYTPVVSVAEGIERTLAAMHP
jgi:nucleoside-diphosphate-sugar epimerase